MRRALLPLIAAFAAAPAISAAPCAPVHKIIFFQWQSDALDDPAIALLKAVIENQRECGSMPILVPGHSDTTETQGMGQARARAVDRWLMTNGIRPQHIRVEGLGSSQPRIETGPGVREILNRRVEIVAGLAAP